MVAINCQCGPLQDMNDKCKVDTDVVTLKIPN
jgi:hypothetical protein